MNWETTKEDKMKKSLHVWLWSKEAFHASSKLKPWYRISRSFLVYERPCHMPPLWEATKRSFHRLLLMQWVGSHKFCYTRSWDFLAELHRYSQQTNVIFNSFRLRALERYLWGVVVSLNIGRSTLFSRLRFVVDKLMLDLSVERNTHPLLNVRSYLTGLG